MTTTTKTATTDDTLARDDALSIIDDAIVMEARIEALLLRGARAFTATVHRAQVRRMAREDRDHARILRRHLRELRGGPRGPGRTPRRVMPLGTLKPEQALEEALDAKREMSHYYAEVTDQVEDRFLRKFVEILGRCEEEGRELLIAMRDAEEYGQVPLGADEFEADLEMEADEAA